MALRLTTAHYFTPDGRDIDGKGLQPDVVLEEDSVRPERTRVDVPPGKPTGGRSLIRKALRALTLRTNPFFPVFNAVLISGPTQLLARFGR